MNFGQFLSIAPSNYPSILYPPTPLTIQPPRFLAQNEGPGVPGTFWLQQTNIWYEPINGYYLLLSNVSFYVFDTSGRIISYPVDNPNNILRNNWYRLLASPFKIYIDGVVSNNACGIFDPLD
jgi:hypothetical protein